MKTNVTKLIKNAQAAISEHSPELLTGIGIASGITATVLAVKATPKALRLIEEAEEEKDDTLTVPETIKTCWKPYVPAVATGVFSVACLIGANSVNARRNATLAAAYKLSETALAEYRDKVVETIGEKKERTVREKVAQERVDKKPVSKSEVIITEKGNTLFFEPLSCRYFKSDIETIRRIVNDLNKRMVGGEQYMSLSEFYTEIGLSPTLISDDIGWRVDRNIIEIDYPAIKADDGTPCLSLDYLVRPEYGYDKIW